MKCSTLRRTHRNAVGRLLRQGLLATTVVLAAPLSAQVVTLYSFTASSGGTLDPMAGASTLIGANQDDAASAVTGIGFTFNYEGADYTQFSVNSNGGMRLGGLAIGSSAIYNLTQAGDEPKVLPFSADGSTTDNGNVSTVLQGTAPNRIRVVQWNVGVDYNASTTNCVFQVWLYEGSNVIEYRYGTGAPSGTGAPDKLVALGGALSSNYINVRPGPVGSTTNSSPLNAWPGDGSVFTFSPPAPCTPPPAPGNTLATVTSGCPGVTTTLSLQNNTAGSGVSYQWQSSPNGVDTWTNVGTSAATYTSGSLSTTTWFRCEVTCSTGPSTVASTPVQIVVSEPAPTYAVYTGTQITESFSTWTNRCSTNDVPTGGYWKNTPAYGPGSWRSSSTTTTESGWPSTSGWNSPQNTWADAPMARFHNRSETPAGTSGTLDFYVDMSAAIGGEKLRFDYINGGNTILVQVSTDAGVTFTTLATINAPYGSFQAAEYTLNTTSATTVIRIKSTALGGNNNDTGIDNFRIVPVPTCAAPTAPTATATAPGSVDIGWTCSGCTGNFYVEYGTPGFTLGTGTVAGPFSSSPATISGLANGSYQAYVRQDCGGNGISENAGPVSFNLVAGDFCANAIDISTLGLPADDSSNPLAGSTTGAQNDYVTSACGSQPGADVVLFHDVEPGATLRFTPQSTGKLSIAIGGSCPGTTSLACTDGGYLPLGPNVVAFGQWGDPTFLWTNNGCNTERVYVLEDGGSVFMWNYLYTTPGGPVCAPVSGVLVSTLSSTSIAVTWDATCSGNVIVEYGPAGFTPGTGATAGGGTAVSVSGTSTTISGLTAGTPYDVYVRQDCAGSFSSNGTAVAFTITLGENCSVAIDLANELAPLLGSTTGAANDAASLSCGSSAGGDLVYFIQVPDGATISFEALHDYDAMVQVSYGSNCPGTVLTCASALDQYSWTNSTGSVQNVYWWQDGTDSGDFLLSWDLQVPCTNDLVLEFQTDGNGSETTWEIRQQGSGNLVQSGGGSYPNNATYTDNACVPDGCYYLRVLDAGGDGIANGGYILRTLVGAQRIIDNRNNFSTGSVSAVVGNGGFCLPLGTDQLIYTSCDKLDWVNNQFIVAAPNAAVSAQWGIGNQTDDGYMFWFFDPNGTYGYAKFRSHATSDGYGTGATRACHARINNWSPNQIPANVLMNVKVRSRVNGVNSAWGPVCRFKIDPVRAACPLTKLMDIPGNPNYSCGVSRAWGSGSASKVVAKPVDGATQYQFRFVNGEIPGGVVRTTTTPMLQLNWSPALGNGTYEVQVRAFKNGAWCVTSLPWGDVCNVTITGSPNAMVLDGGTATSTDDVKLNLFPNPNNGQQLTVGLSAVEAGVETISVDIFDLNGARVSAQVLAVNDGMVYQVVDVAGLADGLYMVHINAGAERYTERLVIAK